MATVVLDGVGKAFGSFAALRDVSLEIAAGEFVVFVGPSGCGKSTLLRIVAGLEEATSGTILIDGERVNGRPPARRGIAMVFQTYALYPHMSVFRNMAFGLRRAGLGRAGVESRVRRAADALELGGLLDRLPRELSGGQRQRVAIGRAIVREPKVFLFDEPLSNLDAALRVQTRLEIARLHRELAATMIYVTHDQVEAMTLADRIVVMNAGRVEQVGAPLTLYHRPANLFVATFLGSPTMNLLEVRVRRADGRGIELERAGAVATVLADGAGLAPGDALTLGVRPEALALAAPGEGAFTGTVDVVEALGESHLVHVAIEGGERLVVRGPGNPAVREGEAVGVAFDGADGHLFRTDGTALARADAGPGDAGANVEPRW